MSCQCREDTRVSGAVSRPYDAPGGHPVLVHAANINGGGGRSLRCNLGLWYRLDCRNRCRARFPAPRFLQGEQRDTQDLPWTLPNSNETGQNDALPANRTHLIVISPKETEGFFHTAPKRTIRFGAKIVTTTFQCPRLKARECRKRDVPAPAKCCIQVSFLYRGSCLQFIQGPLSKKQRGLFPPLTPAS